MALIAPRVTAGLPGDEALNLKHALDGSHDITVFVDGTVHRLRRRRATPWWIS